MNLKTKRILITGASGFIGSRLAERLMNEQVARVRALMRDGTRTTQHAHECVIGDITDAGTVKHAVEGCDIIVHCAALQGTRATLGAFRRVNVAGTLNLLRAARDANVTRFIHVSTINVHGFPPPPDANADSPLVFNGDSYSISKAEGERAAWQFAHDYNLPITIIRPACTYGPHSTAWTLQPIRRLRRNSPVLIGKGDGICNAVYIDNLIDLILLAMKSDNAVGNAFIGAEGRGVSWGEFYGAYARMIGVTHLRSLPKGVALAIAAASEYAARLTRRPPFVSRASIEFYSHKVVYDITKSRKLLGYEPRVSFEEGMARTYGWLIADGKLKPLKR